MAWKRGQAYSQDLRDRVLGSVDGGTGVYAVAELFRVSVSYIYKALKRRRTTGERSPNPNRGHRPRKLTRSQEAALAAHIDAHSDITLARLQDWLEATHGVRLSDGAIHAAVSRLDLSFKKKPGCRRARASRRRGSALGLAGGAGLG